MQNRMLIYLGFTIPLIFWSTLFTCGSMAEGYSHLSNMVSELGTIGTGTQYIFTAGLALGALLSLFFIIGLCKTARRASVSIAPILVMVTFSLSMLGAALFPLPLRMHGILGSPGMALPLSPLLALILWREEKLPGIKLISVVALAAMMLGFLTMVPDVMEGYFGLKQRFFHAGWSIWFISLSVKFLELDRGLMEK